MIYYDKEKTKPVDIKLDENGFYEIKEDNTYYIFGDVKKSIFEGKAVRVYGRSKIHAYGDLTIELYDQVEIDAFKGVEVHDYTSHIRLHEGANITSKKYQYMVDTEMLGKLKKGDIKNDKREN